MNWSDSRAQIRNMKLQTEMHQKRKTKEEKQKNEMEKWYLEGVEWKRGEERISPNHTTISHFFFSLFVLFNSTVIYLTSCVHWYWWLPLFLSTRQFLVNYLLFMLSVTQKGESTVSLLLKISQRCFFFSILLKITNMYLWKWLLVILVGIFLFSKM